MREVSGDEPETDLLAPTRRRVARSILEHGPSTAAELASRLGLTAAGVRRHLDGLAEQGLLTSREQRVYGARGRGRPARVFVLTDAGRDSFGAGYDDLMPWPRSYGAESLINLRRVVAPGSDETRLAYLTDEAIEGRDSFLEKREPDWSGFPWSY